MSHEFNDELISAYLDGELTADEQAMVQQKLHESPEHQQMLSDLRALRDSFESFPSFSLDEQFGGRVLRASERYMLAERSELESSPTVERQRPAPISFDGTKPNSSRPAWQIAAGSVAAVAALLLLTLFLAKREKPTAAPALTDNAQRRQLDAKTSTEDEGSSKQQNDRSDGPVADGRRARKPMEAQQGTTSYGATGNPPESRPADTPTNETNLEHLAGSKAPTDQISEIAEEKSRRDLNRAEVARDRAHGAMPQGGEVRGMDAGGGFAGGGSSSYADDLTDHYTYTVVIEVPRDQLARQPVELALANSNVKEAGMPARTEAFRELHAGKSASLSPPVPANPSASDTPKGSQESAEPLSDDMQRANELLVVATDAQIKSVCDSLNRQGFKTIVAGRALAQQIEMPPRGSAKRFQHGAAGADDHPQSASSTEAAENRGGRGSAALKADNAKNDASDPTSTKPAASADGLPRAHVGPNKTINGTAGGASLRRATRPSATEPDAAPKKADSFDAPSLEYRTAPEKDATSPRPAVGSLSKQTDAEASDSYFLRVDGGDRAEGDRAEGDRADDHEQAKTHEESPEQTPAKSKEEVKQQNAADRQTEIAPVDSTALGEIDKLLPDVQSAGKLRVRFIIRPVTTATRN